MIRCSYCPLYFTGGDSQKSSLFVHIDRGDGRQACPRRRFLVHLALWELVRKGVKESAGRSQLRCLGKREEEAAISMFCKLSAFPKHLTSLRLLNQGACPNVLLVTLSCFSTVFALNWELGSKWLFCLSHMGKLSDPGSQSDFPSQS